MLTFQERNMVEPVVAHLCISLEEVRLCDRQLALGYGYLRRALLRRAHDSKPDGLWERTAKGCCYLPIDLLVYSLRV